MRRQDQASATAQRRPDFPCTGVKRNARCGRRASAFAQLKGPAMPCDEIIQAGMGDRHALRPSGRTGRVDHVGQVARLRLAGRIGGVAGIQRRCVGIQQEHRHIAGRQRRQQVLLRQQHRRRRVFQHVGQAVGRIGRVQRHVSAAGLQDRQQADDHFQRTLDAQAHQHIRTDAQRMQVVRQAVGARIEFAIRQRRILILQRHAVGRRNRALLEQRVDGPSRHTGSRRLVPFH
ncbi:hypothetical protein DUGA6_30100 [Duganella sp. HH105]|nr:hypothetical protein DUGA6_30100 [Duganella sp. HH105]